MKNRMEMIQEKLSEYKIKGLQLEDALGLIKCEVEAISTEEISWIAVAYPSIANSHESQKETTKGAKEDFLQNLGSEANFQSMEREVRHRKISIDYQKITEADAKAEKLKSMDFLAVDLKAVEALKAQNTAALLSFKDCKAFIGPMFNGIVSFMPKELILVLGETGGSKSTVVSNLAWSVVKQKNPKTNKLGKVLIITNEETEFDLFNRIACVAKLEMPGEDNHSWWYSDRSKFTAEQRDYFNQFIERFKASGNINVIGLDYKGESDFTCCLDNVQAILNQAAERPGSYDCVIIDYYQNIRTSLKKSMADEWEVQRDFSAMLNGFKEKIGCPLVIASQMKPISNTEKSWKDRIVGTKAIAQPATLVIEVVAKRESLVTDWIFHKVRYANSTIGKVTTGFKYGRIVPKDASFDSWVVPYLAKKITELTRPQKTRKCAMSNMEIEALIPQVEEGS